MWEASKRSLSMVRRIWRSSMCESFRWAIRMAGEGRRQQGHQTLGRSLEFGRMPHTHSRKIKPSWPQHAASHANALQDPRIPCSSAEYCTWLHLHLSKYRCPHSQETSQLLSAGFPGQKTPRNLGVGEAWGVRGPQWGTMP